METDCESDRRLLTDFEKICKRIRVVHALKQTDEYQRAKFLLMHKDMQSTPPGDPPVTPRLRRRHVPKRVWEREWFIYKSRVRAYSEWLTLMS